MSIFNPKPAEDESDDPGFGEGRSRNLKLYSSAVNRRRGNEETTNNDGRSLKSFSRRRRGDLSDDDPTEKKRRKEPPRPWTKKDRYLILMVLFFTVLTSALLALSAREWKLPGMPRFKIPSLDLLKSEKIIIEGPKKTKPRNFDESAVNTIRDQFAQETQKLSGVYGFYVVDLTSGYAFGVNENEAFTAASLMKLPVMAAMYQLEENGGINLDEKYILKAGDRASGSGSLYSKPAGYEVTYRNLVNLMGKQSDNTAFKICLDKLGRGQIPAIITRMGMDNTDFEKGKTTPSDIGAFFDDLWKENIVSDAHKEAIFESLTETIYEAWLTEGVPEGVRVAHKYGRDLHVVNDAGIVFSKNPYVVVLMSKGVVEREADGVFPKLSKIIFENLDGN